MLSRTLRLLSSSGRLDNHSDRSHPEIARQGLGKLTWLPLFGHTRDGRIALQAGLLQPSSAIVLCKTPTAIHREQNTTGTGPKTLAEVSDCRHGIAVIALGRTSPFRAEGGKIWNRRFSAIRCARIEELVSTPKAAVAGSPVTNRRSEPVSVVAAAPCQCRVALPLRFCIGTLAFGNVFVSPEKSWRTGERRPVSRFAGSRL
jgi:hypothetical protein